MPFKLFLIGILANYFKSSPYGDILFTLYKPHLRCGFLKVKTDSRDRSKVGILILSSTYYICVSVDGILCN